MEFTKLSSPETIETESSFRERRRPFVIRENSDGGGLLPIQTFPDYAAGAVRSGKREEEIRR